MNSHETTVRLAWLATYGLANAFDPSQPRADDGQWTDGSGVGADSPEVKKFTAGSKVRDSAGKPIIMYHGTNADFDSFDEKRLTSKTEIKGFFFSTNKQLSGAFSAAGGATNKSQIMHVALNIRKPATFADVSRLAKAGVKTPHLHSALMKEGFDGIYDPAKNMAVAFRSDQVKIIKKEKA